MAFAAGVVAARFCVGGFGCEGGNIRGDAASGARGRRVGGTVALKVCTRSFTPKSRVRCCVPTCPVDARCVAVEEFVIDGGGVSSTCERQRHACCKLRATCARGMSSSSLLLARAPACCRGACDVLRGAAASCRGGGEAVN